MEAFGKAQYVSGVPVYSDPVRIDDGLDLLTLTIYRDDFKAKVERALRVRVDLSLDSGVTWSGVPNGEKAWPWGHFPIECVTSSGQSVHPVTKEPTNISSMYAPLPASLGPQRMYRIKMTALKETTTRVEVVCSKAETNGRRN